MKFKHILFFILIPFVFACTQKEVVNEGLKSIKLDESKDILPISSFIGELDYIELMLSEVNIEIGEIEDVKSIGGDLIVKQRKAREISFIRFTKEGKFINEIVNNQKGKIAMPLDIIAYEKDFAVLAEDGIYRVSKLGEYKEKIVVGEMAGSSLFLLKNHFYALNETSPENMLLEYAANAKPLVITRPDIRYRKMISSNVSTLENTFHLVSSFSDKVFSFAGQKLEQAYKFDSGNLPMFSHVWREAENLEGKEKQRHIFETKNVLIKNYQENKDYIFITYWVGSNSTSLLINKADWQSLYFAHAVNNIDGGIWEKPMYLSSGNELYVPLSAYKIAGHKISDKRNHDFEKLQLHIAVTENPVIMRCKLK